MHAAGDQVWCAVAVEVADGQRDEMRRRRRDPMHRELLAAVVLQPHETPGGWVVPSVVGADDHDIQVSVAVDVGRLRA